MDTNTLIAQGNDLRAQHRPLEALKCYAQAFVEDPDSSAAWNNYGNVMRECGQPQRAIPFLQHAIVLEPSSATAQFNLAVALLQMGNYEHGWRQYETRWNYEHLAGQLPKYTLDWSRSQRQNHTGRRRARSRRQHSVCEIYL